MVSLAASWARLVATFVAVTLALATGAPVESRTVPLNSAGGNLRNGRYR